MCHFDTKRRVEGGTIASLLRLKTITKLLELYFYQTIFKTAELATSTSQSRYGYFWLDESFKPVLIVVMQKQRKYNAEVK